MTEQANCPCGCGPRATLHERGFAVVDERLEALDKLDKIEQLLRAAEYDARLLDGNAFDYQRWDEAYRLIALLRSGAGRE